MSTPAQTISVETETPSFEIEIAISEQEIAHLLAHHGLSQDKVLRQLKVNPARLHKAANTLPIDTDADLASLYNTLSACPDSFDLDKFTEYCNQLIFLWLNAAQHHSTQIVLQLISCLELKSLFSQSGTSQLHLFLFDLFAKTLQDFQQQQLDYALNFDNNTQLPNVSQIFHHLQHVIEKASKNQTAAVFSMQFMIAKNTPIFSHAITASLSKKITAILKQNISPNHILFHSGNLQFDVFIPHINSDLQLNLLAAKLGRAFEDMLHLSDVSVLVTPFCGGAHMNMSQSNDNDVYTNAKSALESAIAKQQYFVMYSDAIKNELKLQNEIEHKVLEAFATDSLTLFFQPIVDIGHGTCAGAELLLRWSDTQVGHNIYPSITIEILNKVGKGKLFTRWLINSACRYASELINEQQLPIYLTINLRAEDLYDIELPHLLLQSMSLWKVKPQDIVLEITENGILEYNELSTSVIKTLSDSGFRLALDDFGTGFSSLSRLRTMPIDLIKIDQSFVRDIKHSVEDFEIVKSIAMLANSLGKEVLAEGVEDKDCLDLIKQMKIHKCQGYYFAKPMSFEAFATWAKQHQAS